MADVGARDRRFARTVLEKLGRLAVRRVRPKIPSRTLRRALRTALVFGSPHRLVMLIPHYWALYVHDGRGGFTVHTRTRAGRRQPQVLVWFTNPRNDPRTGGGKKYPERERDIKQLTRAQFEKGLERNRKRRKAGRPPYMVVVKRVTRPQKGVPFFTQGMQGFDAEVARVAREEFDKLIATRILPLSQTETVIGRL